MRGIFISMEGPDGSGKSTQIELLKKYFSEKGYEIVITREPGGTKISEAIREIILNKEYMNNIIYYACYFFKQVIFHQIQKVFFGLI